MPPPKLRRATRAKRLLLSYTQYWKVQAAFVEICRKRRRQPGPRPRGNLRDNLRSMHSEVKLLSDGNFGSLQLEALGEAVPGIPSDIP